MYFLGGLSKFIRLDRECKRILIEAAVTLMLVRAQIRFVPFSRYSKHLGKYMVESAPEADEQAYLLAKRITWAVEKWIRLIPLKNECLLKAVTVKYMLRRRKIGSTLNLGVKKGPGRDLSAHAWLRCGSQIVTGEENYSLFEAVGVYGD
jgi:hypothetical protein